MTDYHIKSGFRFTLKQFDPDDTGRYKKTTRERPRLSLPRRDRSRNSINCRNGCMPTGARLC